jgi:sterol desaturase/sphingolipid hydroxylase (fatty acid hydroxylase superfamily)
MPLHKIGYFSEFLIFPPLVTGLAVVAFYDAEPLNIVTWLLSATFGVVLWTLLEYLLHRFAFHHAPFISEIHEQHHDRPTDLIGTPGWMSVALALIAVLLPLWALLGFFLAVGISTGVVVGYLWYVLLHYASHHWQPRHGSYLYRVRMRHGLHHYTDGTGNFGVSVEYWDRLFGTAITPRRNRALTGDPLGGS